MDKKHRALAGDIPVYCAYDVLVSPQDLKPNPRNPNTHGEKQIKLLSKIIQEQGWRAAITVSNRSGYIVRGHGRLAAAKAINAVSVPVEYQDYESEAAEHADLIADNQIAELSEMDSELLDELLQEIGESDIDFELTGFDYEELDHLITATEPPDIDAFFNEPPEDTEPTQTTNSNDNYITCPHCGEKIKQ